jgi:hypothetical protein
VLEIQLLLRDDDQDPTTAETALEWKLIHDATWGVAADPDFIFGRKGTNWLPVRVLVDPRTLKIIARHEGFDDFPEVDALATANAP